MLAERKDFLYTQEGWKEVDRVEIPDDADDWVKALGYSPSVSTIGLEEGAYLEIWHGPYLDKGNSVEPKYPYYVEARIAGKLQSFYIADQVAYLEIIPKLIATIHQEIQIQLMVKRIKGEKL